MARVGAFPWAEGSLDAALVQELSTGPYTAGIVLAEVYEAGEDEHRVLGNLSARARLGRGDDILLGGLILRGGGPA